MNTTFTDLSAALLKGHQSDIGKRPNQEDRWEVREYQTADGRPATLAMVADGIGGHSSGEIASNTAKTMIPTLLLANPPSASETTRRLRAALEDAGLSIYKQSLESPDRAGMGTTCTALVVCDRRLYLAHVGDSRAYLLRGGRLFQLTVDHTWAEEAIRAGRSPEEIKTHPNRGVIMRYLGIDPNINVDTRYRVPDGELVDGLQGGPFHLEPGDTLLLTSDGVSDALDPAFVAEYMAYPDCQTAADTLVASALKAGATDNVTAVLLRLPGGVVAPPPKAAPVAAGGKKLPLPLILGALALVAVIAVAALLLTQPKTPQVAQATPSVGAATVAAPTQTAPQTTQRVAQTTTGGGGVVNATAAPTEVGTVPPAAPISAGEGVTATQEVSGTVSGEPTIAPTFTPNLPPTPRPTATRNANETQPVAAATATRGPAAGTGSGFNSAGVVLLRPAEGEKIIGEAEFAWQPEAGFKLGTNEQYELVIWGAGENGLVNGRSPVGAMTQTASRANLTGVEGALGLQPGKVYWWGVRLRDAAGPKRMLSDGRTFNYERAGGGGSGPSTGVEGPGDDK